MRVHQPIIFVLFSALAACVTPASADIVCTPNIGDVTVTLDYSGTGCFSADDNEQSFLFTLSSFQTLNLYTTSFAANSDPNAVSGGFAPVLTLFHNDGPDNSFIAADSGGVYSANHPEDNTCGPRGLGTADGDITCLDAYITAGLGAGSYRLVLTETGNIDKVGDDENFTPLGYVSCDSVQDDSFSFSQCGNGNYNGPFESPSNLEQLSNAWAVTISAQSASVASPEPAAGVITFSGLLLTLAFARGRRASRTN